MSDDTARIAAPEFSSLSSDARTGPGFSQRRRHSHSKGWRTYLVAAVCLFLALAAGVVIGVGGTIIYFKRRDFTPPPPDRLGKTILDNLKATVDLSAAENDRISAMVEARMLEVERLRRESLDRIRGEFDDMRDDIDDVLGPDRSAKWEEYVKRRMGERKHHRHGKGPRGDGRMRH